MSFSLGDIFVSIVLLLNGIAVLNQERFLSKSTYLNVLSLLYPSYVALSIVGWTVENSGMYSNGHGSNASDFTVKGKIVNLIAAVRMLLRRMPTFILNFFYYILL